MNTEIIVVADQSGSMHSVKDDANGSFQNFINEQRDVPGQARVTLVKFSGHVEKVYQGIDVKSAAGLALHPSGNTALYDAIGHTMNEQRDRIKHEGWADLVVFVIITDGHENASIEFTLEGVKAMTKMAEDTGWKFIYMMSNQDAFEQAKRMGSSGVYTRTVASSGAGQHEAYSYASAETRSLREGPLPKDHK